MMKTQIKAEIVADSLSLKGDRLTSLLITFPRIILSEMNTHRMLSKNTSSSRAIPFKKMVESVQNDPFIPIAWQKSHSGMQGSEYLKDDLSIQFARSTWLTARDSAITWANSLNSSDNGYEPVTKQLCNRLLEPFMWTTMLITGSKEGWDNFFDLRCPQYEAPDGKLYKSKKDYSRNSNWNGSDEWSDLDWLGINKGQAEIHIMDLAEKIYDAMNESTPNQLEAGEWHVPFGGKINLLEKDLPGKSGTAVRWNISKGTQIPLNVLVSTAMAARTSYTVVGDEKEIDYQKQIDLHDRLLAQDPPHSSPMEHCARAMSDEEYYGIEGVGKGWCRNYKGFIQYRHLIENKKYE